MQEAKNAGAFSQVMQKSQFGLEQEVIDKLNLIFSQNIRVQKVIIYGSRAKGNYRSGSDIDLTMIGPALENSDILKIEGQIDELLLPYKVDLSILGKIENSDLVSHIERVGQKFFQR